MKEFTLECDSCNQNFGVTAKKYSRIHSLKRKFNKKCFCSKECFYEFYKKTEPMKMACCVCGETIVRTKRDLSRIKWGVCCSRKCMAISRRNNLRNQAVITKKKEIYDVISKQVFCGTSQEIAEKTGIDRRSINLLRNGKSLAAHSRFCLLEKKEEIAFQVKNVETHEIYECISPSTIFIYLDIPFNKNEAAYIAKLRDNKTNYVSIGEHLISVLNPTKPYAPRAKNFHATSQAINEKNLRVKIARALRRRVNGAIKAQKTKKANFSLNLIGCSVPFLINHIEKQFLNGMSWDNYGKGLDKWNIDHIIPCNTFDLTKPEEQKRCFHYSNLRPLWEIDNLNRPKDGSDIHPEERASILMNI